ncbi:4-hydroxy-tetrahydrodipicolinate reductase [bacterium]|nr:4-hydroxy-tetrahydrodipicolinate reductase [bacterium]
MDSLDEIRVVVSGATGKMGREIVRTVLARADMRLVAALGHARHLGEDIGELVLGEPCGVLVTVDMAEAMEAAQGGVLVEVSTGSNVKATVLEAFAHNVACIVGTTNVPRADEDEINALANEKGYSLLYAPNFALGAVLMMRFAAEASRYFRWAEIIERHHERKLDAPSGTARRTAELMNRARANTGFRSCSLGEENLKGARGGNMGGVRIHSVRMPGVVAQQEVVFGGTEETFHIIHNTTGRACFMPGVVFAIERVRSVKGVVNGLENIIE